MGFLRFPEVFKCFAALGRLLGCAPKPVRFFSPNRSMRPSHRHDKAGDLRFDEHFAMSGRTMPSVSLVLAAHPNLSGFLLVGYDRPVCPLWQKTICFQRSVTPRTHASSTAAV